jgi:uncharacterized protein YceK
MMREMRALLYALVLSALLGGCTEVIVVRNAKTGQTAKCGGEIWTWESAARDQHCLTYFHQQGFDPVPQSSK